MNVQALLENLGLKEVIIDTKKNDNYNYISNLEDSKEPNNFESRWLGIEENVKGNFSLYNLEEIRGNLYAKITS